jgi:hypothetical protein
MDALPNSIDLGQKWREGKVRPVPGNAPHDRLVSRGILSLKEHLRRSLRRHSLPSAKGHSQAPPYAFSQAWRNLSGPMWFPNRNQTLGRSRAASRWSALSPGSRTRREDRAPSHRPQMSSGRLFLDRVGRHQSPSPLHRHEQNNMHFTAPRQKGTFLLCQGGDISTLP